MVAYTANTLQIKMQCIKDKFVILKGQKIYLVDSSCFIHVNNIDGTR